MDDKEVMANRMMVAKMMQDRYDESPPDTSEWARALDGCSILFSKASEHLSADPPRFSEALRCISTAVRTGADLHPQVTMAYALSGQAADDMLQNIQNSLARIEETE